MIVLQQNESEASFLIGMSLEEYVSQFKKIFPNREDIIVHEEDIIKNYIKFTSEDSKKNLYWLYKCHKIFEVYAVVKKDLSCGYLVPAYYPELGGWGAYYPFRNYKNSKYIESIYDLRNLEFNTLKFSFINDETFNCRINYKISDTYNNEIIVTNDEYNQEFYTIQLNGHVTKETVSQLTCKAIEFANVKGYEHVTIRPFCVDLIFTDKFFESIIEENYSTITDIEIISNNRDILHECKLSYYRTNYFKAELELVKEFLRKVSKSTSIYLDTIKGTLPSFKMIDYSGEVDYYSNDRMLSRVKTRIPCFKDIDLILNVLKHQGFIVYSEGEKLDDAYTTTISIVK